KVLCEQKLLAPPAAEQMQTRQVADVLRLALAWTEGLWDFESRSRLDEQFDLKIDLASLLLEAARRLPVAFITSRFKNPEETITPLEEPLVNENLLPAEAYLLSRLDSPMCLRDLSAISGLGEDETYKYVYALALAGLIKREHWKPAFRGQQPTPPPTRKEVK